MAGKRYVRLNTPRDVSKFIAKLINQIIRGEIDSQTARDSGYLARILLECQEKVELQNEIEKIKEKLGMTDESENRTESH